jgi:hypothetical protein
MDLVIQTVKFSSSDTNHTMTITKCVKVSLTEHTVSLPCDSTNDFNHNIKYTNVYVYHSIPNCKSVEFGDPTLKSPLWHYKQFQPYISN